MIYICKLSYNDRFLLYYCTTLEKTMDSHQVSILIWFLKFHEKKLKFNKNPFQLQLPICERICSQLLQNVLKCKNNVNCKYIKHQKHLQQILYVNTLLKIVGLHHACNYCCYITSNKIIKNISGLHI